MIDGVLISQLKILPNERGRLMEIQRSDDPNFPGFGQAYLTETFPGVVKAWYRHHRQVDQIASLTGLIKLVLFDGRQESPTHGSIDVINMGELAPKLVQIPTGVWHGFQALGPHSAFLLHLNTQLFDPDNRDEDRVAPDDPTMPYRW